MEAILVKFPEKMIQKMNELVDTGNFTNRSEFVRQSVRDKLNKIGAT